jgi:group I intron endonuclease
MKKVYCIKNKINGKEYVGFTKKPLEKRFKEHSYPSNKNIKHRSLISDAIRKYGKDNFKIFLLYEGDGALQKEDDFIQKRKSAYNIADGGGMPPTFFGEDHPMYGKKHSEETKTKLRLAWERTRESRSGKNNWTYGKPMSDSTKEALRKANTGRKTSEETLKKLRGRVPWNKGKTHKELGIITSEETREKLRIASTGRTLSEEAKKKISDFHKGKKWAQGYKHSEEAIQKLREKGYNQKHSEETKEKLRQISTGKKQSPETIEKRRQTMIGRKFKLN